MCFTKYRYPVIYKDNLKSDLFNSGPPQTSPVNLELQTGGNVTPTSELSNSPPQSSPVNLAQTQSQDQWARYPALPFCGRSGSGKSDFFSSSALLHCFVFLVSVIVVTIVNTVFCSVKKFSYALNQCCGSMPLTNGSEFRSGSGSCYFRHWPSRCQQKTNFLTQFFLLITFWRYIYIIFQR